MEFAVVPALVAGFVATLVMSALMAASRAMGMTEMPAMPLFVGSMMSPERGKARLFGVMIHYLILGTVVFGLVYGWVFSVVGSSGWLTGALIGLAHGIVVGLMMPLMASMHPRVVEDGQAEGSPTLHAQSDQVVLSRPGMLGVNWGGMTPMGLLLGHVVYGIVVALVYSALV